MDINIRANWFFDYFRFSYGKLKTGNHMPPEPKKIAKVITGISLEINHIDYNIRLNLARLKVYIINIS